jgi:O-antigen/teichoic acid export membrane protein
MHSAKVGRILTEKGIRLAYSGFVNFAARMISVATGLAFALILSRELLAVANNPSYDLWYNISDLMPWFTLMSSMIPFWVMRFAIRRREGSIKTGIFANLILATISMLAYISFVPLITASLGISQAFLPAYLTAGAWIMEIYIVNILETSLQSRTPQVSAYGLMIQQVSLVVSGYILVVVFHGMLLGAVLANTISLVPEVIYYFKLLAPDFKERVRWEYVGEWLKGSLVNIYNIIGNQVATIIFIMLFAFGGEGARGRLGAAGTVASIIGYSSYLAFALYPKLLAEKKSEDVTTSLKMVLMFAIPMTIGAMALADAYVTIITEIYVNAAVVLVVLAADSFVSVVSGLFMNVLYGVETVDEEGKLSLRQLAKSRLFFAFSLPYLHSLITVPTAFYFLTNHTSGQPLQAALWVAIINAIGHFAMFWVLYAIVRKMIRIHIPWKSVAKYLFAAVVMGVILYVIPHPTKILPTMIETVTGGVVYLALIMAIDKEARALPGDVIRELRGR